MSGSRQARQSGIAGAFEIRAAELIRRQRNRSLRIRHAQQRFGETHQCETFCAGNRVLVEQALHRPEWRRMITHGLHPRARTLGGEGPVERAVQMRETPGEHFRFGAIR
jgi:hypothetical protein